MKERNMHLNTRLIAVIFLTSKFIGYYLKQADKSLMAY